MARHTSQNSNIFKNALPVLYLYSMFLLPFLYTFFSFYIFHIPSIFFIFLLYFLYSFYIFHIPSICFIFLLYFSCSFYIFHIPSIFFYIPSIFFIFVLISIQHVTDMDHDAPVLYFPLFWSCRSAILVLTCRTPMIYRQLAVRQQMR